MNDEMDRPTPPPGLVRAVRGLFSDDADFGDAPPPAPVAHTPSVPGAAAAEEIQELRDVAAGVAGAVARLVDADGPDRIDEAERLRPPMDAARTLEVVKERVAECDRDPEAIARAAADALARDISMGARRACLDVLVALGSAALPVLTEMVTDTRWFVVRNGVAVFGEIGGELAIQHLSATLAHDDARVRRESVKSLAQIGGDDAGRLLVGLLDDPEVEIREAAAMAVGHLRFERGVRHLVARLEEEKDEGVQVTLIRALGAIRDPAAVPALEKRVAGNFLSRPPKPIRLAALRALGGIGTPHARGILQGALSEKDEEIQQAAHAALSAE